VFLWRRLHRRAAWLAALAVLTLALVPSVSRALVPLSPAQFVADLCRSDDAAPAHDALMACGLCSVAATPLLLPAAVAAGVAPGAVTAGLVGSPAVAPARMPRATPQARAPPTLG
jgi:hypothetical protein